MNIDSPIFERPSVLYVGHYGNIGLVTTPGGKLLVWSHDGDDSKVQAFINDCWMKDVPAREVIMHILDVAEYKKNL